MNLQLLVDIGIFLVGCAIFTLLLAYTWKFWMLYINTAFVKNIKHTLLEIKLPREITKTPEAAEVFLSAVYDSGGLGAGIKEHWQGAIPAVTSLEIVSLEGVIHFYVRAWSKFVPRIEAAIYSQYPDVEIVECQHDYVEDLPKIDRHNKYKHGFWGADWKLTKDGGIKEYGEAADKKKGTKDKIVELKYSGDMYPIKTYRDWGLDKILDPKQIPNKSDPITYLLEQFGAIGKGEYFCHQILIRDATKWNKIYNIKKEWKIKKGGIDIKKEETESGKELKDLAKLEIEKYRKKWTLKKEGGTEEDEWGNKKGKVVKGEDGSEKTIPYTYEHDILKTEKVNPEKEDQREIEQIQKKMTNAQVIAQMRTIYVANVGTNLGTRIPMTMAILRGFNNSAYNNFGPDMSTFPNPWNYPWEDPKEVHSSWRKERLFEAYINRDGLIDFSSGIGEKSNRNLDIVMFNKPNYVRNRFTILYNVFLYPFKPTRLLSGFTLSLEELATLFHFPGEVAQTPTLPRINSVKSSSPANLPVE